jgi:glycine/D-amino acid oxidase-like deaminating enzyme
MWGDAPGWLGAGVDYHAASGIEVAFTEREAGLLEHEMTLRRDAGLPIEIVDGERARELEPGLSNRVLMGAYCAEDGFAASNLVGGLIRMALIDAGVTLRDGAAVSGIAAEDGGFVIDQGGTRVKAHRILLAAKRLGKGNARLARRSRSADPGARHPDDRHRAAAASHQRSRARGQPDFAQADTITAWF